VCGMDIGLRVKAFSLDIAVNLHDYFNLKPRRHYSRSVDRALGCKRKHFMAAES